MPLIRQIDDLAVQPTLAEQIFAGLERDDMPAGSDDAQAQAEKQSYQPKTFASPQDKQDWIAEQLKSQREQIATEVQAFDEAIVQLIDYYGRAMNKNRIARFNFDERYKLAERRGRGELWIELDDQGQVIRNWADGDRQIKLSLRLSMSAINTAVPVWKEYLFESDPSPTMISARGESDENADKEAVLAIAGDDQRSKANFKAVMDKFLIELCTFKAAVLRQRWSRRIEMLPPPDDGQPGAKSKGYVEQITHEGMKLENWPLPWVWFSDPHKNTVDEQRLTLWYHEATLDELEDEEAVFTTEDEVLIDPVTGAAQPFTRVIQKGRLVNLEAIRQSDDQVEPMPTQRANTQTRRWSQWISRQAARSVDEDKNDVRPIYGIVEGEGRLMLTSMALEGVITPNVVRYYNMPIDNPDAMTRRELGRRLSRIFWNVAVSDTGHLLQFEACPYKPNRVTALMSVYAPDQGIYGKGIPDLVTDTEDIIDGLVNDNILISKKRANRNYTADLAVMYKGGGVAMTELDVERAVNGFNEVIFVNGADASKAIQALFPENNEEWMSEVALLISKLEEQSMINDQLKGATTGATATEVKQNLSRSLIRGLDRAKRVGEEIIERMERNLLADYETFLPASGDTRQRPGAWEQYVLKIAGAYGAKCFYIFPSLKGISDQMEVVHSGNPTINRELTNARLTQIVATYVPLGNLDADVALLRQLAIAREKNPERWLVKGTKSADPRLEIRVLANNNYISPSRLENPFSHYTTHVTQLLAIDPQSAFEQLNQMYLSAALRKIAGPPKAPPGLEQYHFDAGIVVPMLIRHLQETEDLLDAQVAQMQQQQAQMQMQQQAMQMKAMGKGGGGGQPQNLDEGRMEDGMIRKALPSPASGNEMAA